MPAEPLHRAAHLLRAALVCVLLLGLCPPGHAGRLAEPTTPATRS